MAKTIFDSAFSMDIANKRLEHLASLGLSLENKLVLEVGCGIGLLTDFFEGWNCDILSTDGRPENVRENLQRHPHRAGRVFVADLDKVGSHKRFSTFDVVFCYGVLYHLSEPAIAIAEMSRTCTGLLLLDTRVNAIDNGKVNHFKERSAADQAMHGWACQPARDWIMEELRRHFAHVYVTRTQPDHEWYPQKWPAFEKARAVFVASRTPLNLPTLSDKL